MSSEEFAHREWLGYVQPVGLVVSVPALLSAQCYINKNIGREQQRLIDLHPKDKDGTVKPELLDFPSFVRDVLLWNQGDQSDLSKSLHTRFIKESGCLKPWPIKCGSCQTWRSPCASTSIEIGRIKRLPRSCFPDSYSDSRIINGRRQLDCADRRILRRAL